MSAAYKRCFRIKIEVNLYEIWYLLVIRCFITNKTSGYQRKLKAVVYYYSVLIKLHSN